MSEEETLMNLEKIRILSNLLATGNISIDVKDLIEEKLRELIETM